MRYAVLASDAALRRAGCQSCLDDADLLGRQSLACNLAENVTGMADIVGVGDVLKIGNSIVLAVAVKVIDVKSSGSRTDPRGRNDRAGQDLLIHAARIGREQTI